MEMTDEMLFRGNPKIIYPKAAGRGISFKCFKCPSIFDRKESLFTHFSLHGANKQCQCNICDYSVNSEQLLAKHTAKHRESDNLRRASGHSRQSFEGNEDGESHNCTECPATFQMRKDLNLHMYNHGSGQPNQCHLCSYATRRRDYLQKHLMIHSLAQSEVVEDQGNPTEDDSSLKCPECPAAFRHASVLYKHSQRHGGPQKYKCPFCNFAIGRKDALETHIRLHDSEVASPHKSPEKKGRSSNFQAAKRGYREAMLCGKCPFKAPNNAILKIHAKSHGANNPHRCSYCDFACAMPIQKKQHEVLHQMELGVMESPSRAAIAKTVRKSYAKRRIAKDVAVVVSERGSSALSAEEYERLRRGNPSIRYAPVVKRTGRYGKRMVVNTYKCFKCPYRTPDYKTYLSHQNKHGGIPRKFRCTLCDYSTDDNSLEMHIRAHKTSERYVKSEPGVKVAAPLKTMPVSAQESPTKAPQNPVDGADKKKVFSFIEAYSTEPFDKPQFDVSKHLVDRVKVHNFMSLESFDVTITNILSFQGAGKSASITALLLGLGYDLLLEDYSPPSLCGLVLEDLVREGSEHCSIEIVLSLHTSPRLQREFGTHLKLKRILRRGLPLCSTYLEVSPADTKKRFHEEWKVIGKERLREILRNLTVQPELYRIILLDRLNLDHVLENQKSWYGFYDATCNWNSEKISNRLKMLMFKVNRLLGEIHWRMNQFEFLESQLSVQGNPWCSRDEAEKEKLEAELQEFNERREALEFAVNSYGTQLNKLRKTMTGRLKFRFQEFLHRQNYVGSILVDDEEKEIGVWVRGASFNSRHPQTAVEAMDLWSSTPLAQQRLAAIGLIFALIDISHSPIFFIDAYSSRPTEFSIPPESHPLLLELIEKKCSQGHQFVASLSDKVK